LCLGADLRRPLAGGAAAITGVPAGGECDGLPAGALEPPSVRLGVADVRAGHSGGEEIDGFELGRVEPLEVLMDLEPRSPMPTENAPAEGLALARPAEVPPSSSVEPAVKSTDAAAETADRVPLTHPDPQPPPRALRHPLAPRRAAH
jgi:hypothetical protein